VDHDYDPEPIASTAFAVLHPHDGISPRYLFHYFRSPAFVAYVQSVQSGIAYPAINDKKFYEAQVPLPPTDEQHRIVAKVDELMALCDKLESQRHDKSQIYTKVSRLITDKLIESPSASTFSRALQYEFIPDAGDLHNLAKMICLRGWCTSDHNDDLGAQSLLSKTDQERTEFAETHGFKLPRLENANDDFPFGIKPNWAWVRLHRLFMSITDGDHQPPPKSDTGIPFLTIGNIASGTLDFSSTRFVPRSYYDQLAVYRRPARGDILYTVVGATYGRAAYVDTDRPFCVQRHIAILRPATAPNVMFLLLLLRSPLVYDQATRGTTGIAQPTIPLAALRNFLVPLPPRGEQDSIVDIAARLAALVDKVEQTRDQLKTVADRYTTASIAALTDTSRQDAKLMKAPSIELLTHLQIAHDLAHPPGDGALLARLLGGEVSSRSAKVLWRRSGLSIDAFYQQLKKEMAAGWIVETRPAEVREATDD
jgi:type I restriction enzyme S subunit